MRLKKHAENYAVASAPAWARTRAAMARSIDMEKPIEGDEFAARIGPVAAPVLDENKMFQFVSLMGPDWVAKALLEFAIEVEGRMASLDAATPSKLASSSHAMIMMAGMCGFTELLDVSEVAQREARQGAGLNRVAALRAAGERALAAMRSYVPRP